jgi:hypothetical protein
MPLKPWAILAFECQLLISQQYGKGHLKTMLSGPTVPRKPVMEAEVRRTGIHSLFAGATTAEGERANR